MGILICIYYIPIICLVINHENASTNTDSPYGITFDAVAGRGHRLLQSDARIFFGGWVQSISVGILLDKLQIYIYINKLYIYILYYFIVYYIYYSVYTHKIMIITVMTICNHD